MVKALDLGAKGLVFYSMWFQVGKICKFVLLDNNTASWLEVQKGRETKMNAKKIFFLIISLTKHEFRISVSFEILCKVSPGYFGIIHKVFPGSFGGNSQGFFRFFEVIHRFFPGSLVVIHRVVHDRLG